MFYPETIWVFTLCRIWVVRIGTFCSRKFFAACSLVVREFGLLYVKDPVPGFEDSAGYGCGAVDGVWEFEPEFAEGVPVLLWGAVETGVVTTPEFWDEDLTIFLPLGRVSSIKFSQGLLQTQYSSLIPVMKSVKVKQFL